jgi:ribonuclease BN (tRNA processing enzyme)
VSEVVLLGSGGWIPTASRATCSALVRRDEHALLIDAGTGISRLLEEAALLEGVRTLDLVLTHFHLDHVVGLAYLPALPVSDQPRIHGPGKSLYGIPTDEVLGRMLDPPLFALGVDELASSVEEIGEGRFGAGPFELTARVQVRHNHPTLALRLDDELTYCTDTAYDPGNVDFAKGSRLLCHEAWYTEDAPREESTHSSASGAARIARDAEVEQLVLIHIRPGADDQLLQREASSVFEASAVGTDLHKITAR